jgi:hypothetical protein
MLAIAMKCALCVRFYNSELDCRKKCDPTAWPSDPCKMTEAAKKLIVGKASKFHNGGSRASDQMKSDRLVSVLEEFEGEMLDSTEAVEKTDVYVQRQTKTKVNSILSVVIADDELFAVMLKYYTALCSHLYTLSETTGANVVVRCTPETEWFFATHVLMRAATAIAMEGGVAGKCDEWLKTEFIRYSSEPLLRSAGLIFVEDCVIQALTVSVEDDLGRRLAEVQACCRALQDGAADLESEMQQYRLEADASAARLMREKAERQLYRLEAEASAARLTTNHKREKAEQKAQHRKNMKEAVVVECLSLPELKEHAEKYNKAYQARLESDLDNATLCNVCMEDIKSIVVLPCNHLSMCAACAQSVLTTAHPVCPICRTPATGTIRVY